MIVYRSIEISETESSFVTSGLFSLIGRELRLNKYKKDKEEYIKSLSYLIDYVFDEKPEIKDEQTIAFYSWLVKVKLSSNIYYDLWEAKSNGEGFIKGVDFSLNLIADQTNECFKQKVSPLFPTFSQKIVISKGVFEGLEIDAVRYPSPNHMTGWYLTTDLYDDNIDSLRVVYYFDVAFKRPDVLKYLALPNGFRFHLSDMESDILFDKSALED